MNNDTPELRFNNFTNDPIKYKLSEITKRIKSYSLSRNVETKEDTGYKYIHYGDIHKKVANIIDRESRLPNIKPGNYELLKRGDLVIADASEDYQGIAAPSIVNDNLTYNIVAGLHTIALRPIKADSLYLYYLFNSQKFRKYGYKVGTGMKVFGISVSNLVQFESYIPSISEQVEVGILLKKVDQTIKLQQQLLNDHKQLKKAMLQKMFPQKGESVPRVRFAGFTDVWKEEELGSLVEIKTGKLDANAMKVNGAYDFYTSGIKKYKIDIPAFKGPAITIAGNGATVGYMHYADGDFNAYQRTYVLTNFLSDRLFLFQSIKLELPKKIYQEARMGNIPYIVMSMLTGLRLFIPTTEEQTKIGKIFKQLDETIEIHEKKLETYQELKKAMLQKMFV